MAGAEEASAHLEGVPLHGYVGYYSGGDGLRFANRLFQSPIIAIPSNLRETILDFAFQSFERFKTNDIFRLPQSFPSEFEFRLNLQVTNTVNDVGHMNFFFQGLLFEHHLNANPEALGFSRYPLVGVLNPDGIIPHDDSEASVGINALHPSDQHCHCDVLDLDGFEFRQWYVGDNMSRFIVSKDISSGWLICCDPHDAVMEVTFVVLIASSISSDFSSDRISDVIKYLKSKEELSSETATVLDEIMSKYNDDQ